MTRIHIDEKGNRIVMIEPQEDEMCELCGAEEETRPYGPNGEKICYECGMKNEEQTKKMLCHLMFGDPLPNKPN